MSVLEAIIAICLMVPMIVAFGFVVAKQKLPEIFAWIARAFEKPAITPPPTRPAVETVEDMAKRYERLAHQDWEHEFRKLNKGKAWDHKPLKVARVTRKATNLEGETTVFEAWGYHTEEGEVICNPCARGHHEKCSVWNDTGDCYCECQEGDYEHE